MLVKIARKISQIVEMPDTIEIRNDFDNNVSTTFLKANYKNGIIEISITENHTSNSLNWSVETFIGGVVVSHSYGSGKDMLIAGIESVKKEIDERVAFDKKLQERRFETLTGMPVKDERLPEQIKRLVKETVETILQEKSITPNETTGEIVTLESLGYEKTEKKDSVVFEREMVTDFSKDYQIIELYNWGDFVIENKAQLRRVVVNQKIHKAIEHEMKKRGWWK